MRVGGVKDVVKVTALLSWKIEIVPMDGVKDGVFILKNRGYNHNDTPIYSRKKPQIAVISEVFYREKYVINYMNLLLNH